ncbi:MAG: hypothetical protein ACK45H_07095 [Bacteroidota bacterium]|jgi:hypothetical protein
MEGKKRLTITDQRIAHLLRHFSQIDTSYRNELYRIGLNDHAILEACSVPGSKFDPCQIKKPDDIIGLVDRGKTVFSILQPNGNHAITLEFDFNIGSEGILSMNELTSSERELVTESMRSGTLLKFVRLPQLRLTNRLTLVTNINSELVTAFPGRYAPPLPYPEMVQDEKIKANEFWNNHVFIEVTQ